MTTACLSRPAVTPDECAALAARIAPHLVPGDCILLEGPIGAGKTHFARALIQARLAQPEEIPSPTYTLIQTYQAPECEIWHCDLYRLADSGEVPELGIGEALERAICLIEWPDRLGSLRPGSALTIRFALTGQEGERLLTAQADDPRWARVLGLIHE